MDAKTTEINKFETLDASDIGLDADSIDCHLAYSIYCNQDRKENSLINTGICPDMAEYPLLAKVSPLAILRSVGVEYSERGNGYGKELVEAFLNEANLANAMSVLVVDTLQFQEDGFCLTNFYKSLGFVDIAETELYDLSQKETCSLPVMVKMLKANNDK